jgi:regulator of protease activity HflC (stomatin/prohibitin superfamily)
VKSLLVRGCLAVVVVAGYAYLANVAETVSRPQRVAQALTQLSEDGNVREEMDRDHAWRGLAYSIGWMVVAGLVIALFEKELRMIPAKLSNTRATGRTTARTTAGAFALLVLSTTAGCWRPFEPVQLETINPNEEAFLLPLLGDVKAQTSTNNEEYLRSNLVYTKQVKIPQQWVQKGFETLGPNGSWKPAAILVKVDKSPVTREWTADPNSGTSNKNEAIWVMTSDQVEFSTGWTCTARIASRDDAVKFLHNYPNGSLQNVMDTELRAKLQAAFGLEVTDLPMDILRKEATPHIVSVIDDVTEFFKERGITITNLGITGGFVYKDKTIMDTMVKVFNAEQEKAIASAAFQAQDMKNKTVESEAQGRAKALLTSKQAEADGIKAVADAKAYEIEKAKEDTEIYLALKRLEIEKEKLTKWDGRFPTYFMGTGGSGNSPDLLLQVPADFTARRPEGK